MKLASIGHHIALVVIGGIAGGIVAAALVGAPQSAEPVAPSDDTNVVESKEPPAAEQAGQPERLLDEAGILVVKGLEVRNDANDLVASLKPGPDGGANLNLLGSRKGPHVGLGCSEKHGGALVFRDKEGIPTLIVDMTPTGEPDIRLGRGASRRPLIAMGVRDDGTPRIHVLDERYDHMGRLEVMKEGGISATLGGYSYPRMELALTLAGTWVTIFDEDEMPIWTAPPQQD